MRLKISLLALGVLLFNPNLFSQLNFVQQHDDGDGTNNLLRWVNCIAVDANDQYVGKQGCPSTIEHRSKYAIAIRRLLRRIMDEQDSINPVE